MSAEGGAAQQTRRSFADLHCHSSASFDSLADTRKMMAKAVRLGLTHLAITDPKALENARKDLADLEGEVTYTVDPYEAAEGADAVAVLTEWRQYRELDFERIFHSMRQPAFLFDGRNILDHRTLRGIGFQVYPLGSRSLTSF